MTAAGRGPTHRKALWRRVHAWLALAASLPLLVLAVTGALLVFPEPSRRLVTGVDLRVGPGGTALPPSELIARARGAMPDGEPIARLVYPAAADEPLWIEGKQRLVAVDPTTGRVLLSTPARGEFRRVVTRIHVDLMAGPAGSWVTGLSSVALVVLCLSGLRLWWPVGRWTRAYFAVKAGGGPKRLNFDLHRATGFYLLLPLLAIAATGAAMAFWGVLTPPVYWLTRSSPMPVRPDSVAVREGVGPISPDRALELALARHPGLEPRRLYPPAGPGKPFRVFLDPPGEHETRANEVRLDLDPQTGEVVHEDSPATMSRGDKLLRWVLPLHFGTFGGTPTKLLYVAASLAPVVLAATGTILWAARLRKRRRSAAGRGDRVLVVAAGDLPRRDQGPTSTEHSASSKVVR